MKTLNVALTALTLGLSLAACTHTPVRTSDAQPVTVIAPPAQPDVPADQNFAAPARVTNVAPVPVDTTSAATTSATTETASPSLGASSSGRGH